MVNNKRLIAVGKVNAAVQQIDLHWLEASIIFRIYYYIIKRYYTTGWTLT